MLDSPRESALLSKSKSEDKLPSNEHRGDDGCDSVSSEEEKESNISKQFEQVNN